MRIKRLAVAVAVAAVIATPLAVANADDVEVTGNIVVRTFWNTGPVEGEPNLSSVLAPVPGRSCDLLRDGEPYRSARTTGSPNGFTTFSGVPIGTPTTYTVRCEPTFADVLRFPDATQPGRTNYVGGTEFDVVTTPVGDNDGQNGTDYGDFLDRVNNTGNNAWVRFSWEPREGAQEPLTGNVPRGGEVVFTDEESGAETTVTFPSGQDGCGVSSDGAVPVTVVNGDVLTEDDLPGYARLADIDLPTEDEIGTCLFEIRVVDEAPEGINRIRADLDGTGDVFSDYTELEFCSAIGGGPTAGSTIEGSLNEELWCLDRVKYTGLEDDAATTIDLTIRGYNDPRTAW